MNESRKDLLARFEAWFSVAYPMFGKSKDTTLKHRLWTAWQVAAYGTESQSDMNSMRPEEPK